MKRNLALIVCIIATVAMLFTLASCGGNDKHEHTYSAEYSSDTNGHWYQATCGCEGEVKDYGVHKDTNGDGACDVCKYDVCDHDYSDEWSSDEKQHWHAATCDCTAAPKKDVADHVDADKNGICDVCEYVVCDHSDVEWKSDENEHWKVPTCDCENVEITEKGEHADEDENGRCDACGRTTDFDLVLEDIIGSLESEAWFDANSSVVIKNGEETFTKVYDNYTVVKDAFGNTKYYSYYGENDATPFVIIVSGEEVTRDEYSTEPEGVASYSLVYYNVTANNHEDAIKGLYELAIYGSFDWEGNPAGLAYGLVSTVNDEKGTYSFSYLFVEAGNYYYVDVEFAVDAERNGIASATIIIKDYAESDITLGEDGVSYTINEGAEATVTTYAVTQTFGDPMDSKDAPNPYKPEDYIITDDFSIVTKDEEGNVVETYEDGDTIEVDANKQLTFYFNDEVMEKLPFNLVSVSCSGINYSDVNYYFNTYSAERPTTFTGKKGGEYTLTFDVEGKTITLNMKVNWLTPTEIGAATVDEYGDKTQVTEAVTFVGNEFIFTSYVAASCDPAFTAALTTGTNATLTDNENGTYTFVATEAGDYVVTITSTKDTTLTATLSIKVNTPPTPAEVLVGKHAFSQQMAGLDVSAAFTPANEGATTGTVVISYVEQGWWSTTELKATYTYEFSPAGIALTYVSGDEAMFALSINNNYQVVLSYFPYGAEMPDYSVDYDLEYVGVAEPEEPEEPGDEVEGTSNPFNVTVSDTYGYYDADAFTFVAGEDGKYTFTLPAGLGMLVNGNNEVATYFDNTEGTTFELTLEAGQTVTLIPQAITTGTFAISYEVSEPEEEEEPTLSGSGTQTDPYIITQSGDYVADYQGGGFTVFTWYQYEATMDGEIVFTYTGNGKYWLSYGTNPDVLDGASMTTYTISVSKGDKVYLAVQDYNGSACEIPFTVTLPTPSIAGEYTMVDGWNNEITMTITKDTIKFTPLGPGAMELTFTYTYANGIVTLYDAEGVEITNPLAGYMTVSNNVPTEFGYNGTTYTFKTEGGEDASNGLVLGANAVNVTVSNYYCAGTTVTFTATEAGKYTISAAEGEENADVFCVEIEEYLELPYEFELEAGETITFIVATTEFMTLTEDTIDLVIAVA